MEIVGFTRVFSSASPVGLIIAISTISALCSPVVSVSRITQSSLLNSSRAQRIAPTLSCSISRSRLLYQSLYSRLIRAFSRLAASVSSCFSVGFLLGRQDSVLSVSNSSTSYFCARITPTAFRGDKPSSASCFLVLRFWGGSPGFPHHLYSSIAPSQTFLHFLDNVPRKLDRFVPLDFGEGIVEQFFIAQQSFDVTCHLAGFVG